MERGAWTCWGPGERPSSREPPLEDPEAPSFPSLQPVGGNPALGLGLLPVGPPTARRENAGRAGPLPEPGASYITSLSWEASTALPSSLGHWEGRAERIRLSF